MKSRSPGLVALSAFLGVGAFVGMAGLGERTPEALLATLVASGAAAATVILVVERPVAAFGLLFILASVSGVVVGLSVGRVRLEQPSIVAAVLTLFATRGWPTRSDFRLVLPVIGSFVAYLLVLAVASALNAPKPIVSARLIIWTVLSMTGGVVAFAVLTRLRLERIGVWFTATAVVHASLGLVVAAAFLVMGPKGIPGMQVNPGEAPKVAALAFEANLYASMLGALAFFGFERFRARPALGTAIPAILIVVGVGLGVTRGAYLGLGAGLLVYLSIVAFRSPRRSNTASVIPVIMVALLLAPAISAISLPVERDTGAVTSSSPPEPTNPSAESARPSPSRSLHPSPSPTIAPSPSPTQHADTIGYRIDRIPTALNDFRTSPIIGLGAASFGQRHENQDLPPGTPDYIGILVLVTLYESGVIGTAALALGFALSFRLLLRLSRDRPGLAAAYAASITSLLVAYQGTNALFFSITWIILGAGLALVVRESRTRVTLAT